MKRIGLWSLSLFWVAGVWDGCQRTPLPAEVDLLVRGGTVLTMDSAGTVHDPGFVAVRGDAIVAVGSRDEASLFEAARVIEAEDDLILPGLVNGHQHAAMVLMRGLGDDLPLLDWLHRFVFPVEREFVDEEFVYWGTLLAAAEMIRTGTTTFADMYYFEGKVAEAVEQAGLRGVLGQTIIGFPAPDHESPQSALAYTEEFITRWKGHPLVTPAVAPHAPYTCSPEVLQAARALSERHGVPLLIHLAETQDEVRQVQEEAGLTPVAYLASLGLLSHRVIAAHVVWPSSEEIRLLREYRVGVIHNPRSNMKLASGVAPLKELWEASVELGLGSDGAASTGNLDLFQEMAAAARLQKVTRRDASFPAARQVVELATIGGARALKLEDLVGSLEVGKQADLVVVQGTSWGAVPSFDPYSTLVYGLNGSAVRTVVVAGRVLLDEGRLQTVDTEAVLARARDYQRALARIKQD